jgi:putative tryptophan/tyrosine transport system substrate-binding protein
MHRRDIVRLGLVGGASLSVSALVRAHEPPFRIGALIPVPDNGRFSASLRDGLRDLGWIEGSAFTLQFRQADGTVAAFRRLGGELAALPVDVLLTASTTAATALAQTTTTIPIVFVGTFDPVAAGLVESLDHPGRNLTGIAGFQVDIATKWVSQLKEIAPSVTEMAIFSNPASVSSAALDGWKAVASQSVSISDLHVDAVADIEPAVADLAKNPHAGVIVVPHTFPLANRKAVVDAMAKHRVPAMYGVAEMVRSGGLISYGQDLAAQWRMSAVYVDKIMHGTKPADLPVQYETKYSLALNKAAAHALGLEIPKAMLERADEIIEQS